ncbi:unnamed protein product, partial [Heterosigma akashiwo]
AGAGGGRSPAAGRLRQRAQLPILGGGGGRGPAGRDGAREQGGRPLPHPVGLAGRALARL